MWADNSCLFHDNKERLVCMVNHIIAELLDLDMEANPGSLCRGKKALEVGDGEGGEGGEGGSGVGSIFQRKSLRSWDAASIAMGKGPKVHIGRMTQARSDFGQSNSGQWCQILGGPTLLAELGQSKVGQKGVHEAVVSVCACLCACVVSVWVGVGFTMWCGCCPPSLNRPSLGLPKMTPEKPNAHFRWSTALDRGQDSREDPQREEMNEICGGEREKREILGHPPFGLPLFPEACGLWPTGEWPNCERARTSDVVQRHGQSAARWTHLPFKKCTHKHEVSKSSQPRLQHCSQTAAPTGRGVSLCWPRDVQCCASLSVMKYTRGESWVCSTKKTAKSVRIN